MEKEESKIYISTENEGKCDGCGREEDLRYKHCFDCAEIQGVILTGNDMDDNKISDHSLMKVRWIVNRVKEMLTPKTHKK